MTGGLFSQTDFTELFAVGGSLICRFSSLYSKAGCWETDLNITPSGVLLKASGIPMLIALVQIGR